MQCDAILCNVLRGPAPATSRPLQGGGVCVRGGRRRCRAAGHVREMGGQRRLALGCCGQCTSRHITSHHITLHCMTSHHCITSHDFALLHRIVLLRLFTPCRQLRHRSSRHARQDAAGDTLYLYYVISFYISYHITSYHIMSCHIMHLASTLPIIPDFRMPHMRLSMCGRQAPFV